MRTIEVKLYQYEELSDAAKDKAREWWKECESQDFGGHGENWEAAETAANLLGIEFGTNTVKLYGGGTRIEPDIRYSGFWSQGDGASFVGTYEYKKGSAKAVQAEFPTDTKLRRIAEELTALQKQHGYKLACKVTQDGRYVHQYTMDIEITAPDSVANGDDNWFDSQGRAIDGTVYETLRGAMRDFAGWIYKGLEEEYNYRTSDEQAAESIIANEYEFTENGDRA